MTRVIKPMLAPNKPLKEFEFPYLASPKIDGIRMLVVDGVCQSRSGKAIPCPSVQRLYGHLEGLDGELAIGPTNAKDLMQRTMGVMSNKELSIADLEVLSFNVFDYWPGGSIRYADRLSEARLQIDQQCGYVHGLRLVPHYPATDQDMVDALEAAFLSDGYEGLMLNRPDAGYRNGRCGVTKKSELVKVKRFVDDEATIIGFSEMMHNDNEAFTSELGRTKRATLQENLRPAGVLGSLKLRVTTGTFTGAEFDCSGFTAVQRASLWSTRETLGGKLVTFKHFEQVGAKDRPRQPVFKGFRSELDT